MKVPAILYGKSEAGGIVQRRYGASRLGICVIVVSSPGLRNVRLPNAYFAYIGRLGINYGIAGGVEAGLDELTPRERGRCRIFHRPDGMAIAINWGRG
ncbi:MAG: hypothetical protein Q8O56_07450 [Solirubrobacteraceae bacterium]|nr:hypothetical protein [Solirubrobacteraceae bacterium]